VDEFQLIVTASGDAELVTFGIMHDHVAQVAPTYVGEKRAVIGLTAGLRPSVFRSSTVRGGKRSWRAFTG
jgi:hypothetical protein